MDLTIESTHDFCICWNPISISLKQPAGCLTSVSNFNVISLLVYIHFLNSNRGVLETPFFYSIAKLMSLILQVQKLYRQSTKSGTRSGMLLVVAKNLNRLYSNTLIRNSMECTIFD